RHIGVVRAANETPVGARVVLAMRPEKIRLGKTPVAGGISGVVVAATYFGEQTRYAVAVPGVTQPVQVSVSNAGAQIVSMGDSVSLSMSESDFVILPP